MPPSAKTELPCATLGATLFNIYQASIRRLRPAREERVCVRSEERGARDALTLGFHAARNQQNKLPKSIMAAPACANTSENGKSTCMIIVKDSSNCLLNVARPVTDTGWLKRHQEDSRRCRHTAAALAFPLSPFIFAAHRFRCDGSHKPGGKWARAGPIRRRRRRRDLTSNLAKEKHQREILQPARNKKRAIKGGIRL